MRFIASLAAAMLAAICLAASAMAVPPARLHVGSNGPVVVRLQNYLHANVRADFYGGAFDGAFGPLTKSGLQGWQKANGYRSTGSVVIGSSQWNKLRQQATVSRLAGYISQTAINAARSSGWAVDASKSQWRVVILRYMPESGVHVALSIAASFGGPIGGVQYRTDDGVFRIYAEFGPDFVSQEYHAPMAYAACFNGSQCLHYDGLFPSHGCIHIPSMSAAQYINRLPIGTTVVVHE